MKRLFFLSLVFIVMAGLSSCQHKEIDEKSVIDEICDDVCGAYRLESVCRIDGTEMDLDGDGKSSVELMHEFVRLPSAVLALTYIVRVERVQEYDSKKYFRIEIPVQYLDYDASSKEYSFANKEGHGGTANFSLYYTVLPSGDLSYGYGSSTNLFASDLPVVGGKTGVDIADARYYDFVRFGDGVLNFIVNAGLYDFASKEYVKVPVSYTYRKVN